MSDIKSFFHAWCNKSKVEPQFESRPTGKNVNESRINNILISWTWVYRLTIQILGPKHRQRFLCELRVPGFNYVGAGNSTVKKDAEKNAARDYVSFLVRSGNVIASDVPGDIGDNAAPSLQPLMGQEGMNRNNQVFKVIFFF